MVSNEMIELGPSQLNGSQIGGKMLLKMGPDVALVEPLTVVDCHEKRKSLNIDLVKHPAGSIEQTKLKLI